MPEAGGELVQLFIYDLSGGMARAFSQMLLGRSIEAVYHTSIVVAGSEFYFGGGINVARAGHTPFGRPLQVLDLGQTQLPEDVRDALLAELSERYTRESYSLFSNNCNNFSDELAQLLCGRGVPDHITGLPAEVLATPFGQMIAPMLSGLEEQMRGMRSQAYRPHIEAAAAVALPAPPAPSTSAAAAVLSAPPAPGASEAPPAGVDTAVAAEPAVPVAGTAGAAGAAEEEGAGLRSAEMEIEVAVAAGMMQEAEQALGGLALQPGAGQQPAAAAAAAEEPDAKAGGPAAAPPAPAAPADAATSDKLATELAVEAEFKRLVTAGVAEREAQALALEAVAAAAGVATDSPVLHGQRAGGSA